MMRYVISFLVVLVLAISVLGGVGPLGGLRDWFLGGEGPDTTTFWCPMDPEIVRKGVGMCPICNMELVPFEGRSAGGEPDVLVLSDRQTQQAGVRLGTASVLDLVREIDGAGRLTVSPSKRTNLVMRYPGRSRVERVHVYAAGEKLRAGEVVAEIYNATMLDRLKEYRGLLKRYASLRKDAESAEAESVFDLMRTLKMSFAACGMPPAHLDVLAAKPKHLFTDPLFPVILPAAGVVLKDPEFSVGESIKEGQPLLEVADLSELWLFIDLYEHERSLVEVGQTVEFSTPAVPGETFRTRVRFIDPIIQENTQTVRARCRVWNAAGALSPGMFVRASIVVPVTGVLAVPESAVLQSGRRAVAIVSEGGGRFRPRLVHLGKRHLSLADPDHADRSFAPASERYHEILMGLHDGERVVVAGIFLLNAEAQFQGTLKKMIAAQVAQERAFELSEAVRREVSEILRAYGAIVDGLVLDDPTVLVEPCVALAAAAERAAALNSPLHDSFARMAVASREIAALASSLPAGQNEENPRWIAARTFFGTLSREVVFYVRDYAPASVNVGELYLFQCPMADDFGFDRWLQASPELQNPYMGQWMAECGNAVEFE